MPHRRGPDRQHATRRRGAVVVLLLQALLWMAGPTIEARAEARAVGATAHVEELGGDRCPPIHSHLECQICRTLRGGAPAPPAMDVRFAALRTTAGVAGSSGAGARPAICGAIGSRAPPARPDLSGLNA